MKSNTTPRDPILVAKKKEILEQQLQQIAKTIGELQQQKASIEDMISAMNDQGQRIMGALNLIAEIG